MSIEAMKMALELLKRLSSDLWMGNRPDKVDRTILALEVALAQPEQNREAWLDSVCALLRQAHDILSMSSSPPSKQDVNQELVEALKEKVFEPANVSTAQRIAQAAIAKAEEQA